MSKCQCGKRKSKYSNLCNSCNKVRREKQLTENRAVFEKGVCPNCGSGLHLNIALRGWVQCNQFGTEGFRKDSSKPKCDYQSFVE